MFQSKSCSCTAFSSPRIKKQHISTFIILKNNLHAVKVGELFKEKSAPLNVRVRQALHSPVCSDFLVERNGAEYLFPRAWKSPGSILLSRTIEKTIFVAAVLENTEYFCVGTQQKTGWS